MAESWELDAHESRVPDAHESAARSIPWLLNGTLGSKEALALQDHLAVCGACRADLEAERRLYEALRTEGPVAFGGEGSFEKLNARIEADAEVADAAADVPFAPQRIPVVSQQRWHASAPVRWLAAAVLIEGIGLALGPLIWRDHTPVAAYQTLSSAPTHYGAGVRVRVVFTPQLSLGELQQLLGSIDAHLVDGPTEAHAYTLGFADASSSQQTLSRRLQILRADPHVRLAEPVGAGAAPP